MKWFKALLTLTLLLGLIGTPQSLAVAAVPAPAAPKPLPLPPQGADMPSQESVSSSTTLVLPALKAVLVVGPIDGDYGSWTTKEKNNMDLAKAVLQANGVEVHTFYAPNTNWDQINAAANGAHFFLYRGHGIEWNSNPLVVGGLALSDGNNGYSLISNDDIRSQLHLAKNAIVMVYGCYAAGSYGGEVNLTAPEAYNRVDQYAHPFFDAGAGAYYSNWYSNAFQMILQYIFSGQTLGQAYQSYGDYNPATVERYTFPGHPEYDYWLDKDYYQGGWKYDYAFAGLSGSNLENLYGTRMVSTPSTVFYLNTSSSGSRQRGVVVTNQGSINFTWSATLSGGGSWASGLSLSGSSGDAARIAINPKGLNKGTYQATLNISTSTPGVAPRSQSVPVTLIVVNQVYQTFLPISLAP